MSTRIAAALLWPADPATARPPFWGDDQGRIFVGAFPDGAEGLRCSPVAAHINRVQTLVHAEYAFAQVVTPETNLLELSSEFYPDPWARPPLPTEMIDIQTLRVDTDAGVWILHCGYGPRSRQWFVKGQPVRYVSEEAWMQGADRD